MILERLIKFMSGTVGTFVGFGKQIQVRSSDRFTIEHNFDPIRDAGDINVVPLARRFHGVAGWLYEIVERARVVKARALGIVDGDFDSVVADVAIGTRD